MFNDIDISFKIVLTYAEIWMKGGGDKKATALTRNVSCLELYGPVNR